LAESLRKTPEPVRFQPPSGYQASRGYSKPLFEGEGGHRKKVSTPSGKGWEGERRQKDRIGEGQLSHHLLPGVKNLKGNCRCQLGVVQNTRKGKEVKLSSAGTKKN